MEESRVFRRVEIEPIYTRVRIPPARSLLPDQRPISSSPPAPLSPLSDILDPLGDFEQPFRWLPVEEPPGQRPPASIDWRSLLRHPGSRHPTAFQIVELGSYDGESSLIFQDQQITISSLKKINFPPFSSRIMGRISNKHRRALKKIKAHALDDNSYLDKEKDDEIDAFHKQREMIPLDFNKDIKFSDDDAEEPIFDLKAKHNGDRYNGRDDDEEDDKDDEDFTDAEDKGFAAKIARQLKYLKERFGGVEDEMSDDDKSDEERNIAWGRNMNLYYGADNIDYELQSSDEDLLMEEKEVMKIERGRAKILVKEDFGLESSDEEGNFVCGKISQVLAKKRPTTKRGANFIDGIADLNPVSKKDRMDLLCRLVTLDDFDDMARHSKHHGSASGPQSSNKLVLTARTKKNGWKILSGDEDAPKRDDIGERRGKQELRAPSRGGVTDAGKKDYCSAGIYGQGNNFQKSGKIESEDEFYRGVKKQRTEKLAAKEKPYAGPQLVPEEEHPSVGRRPIPREIQQNRGLTRYRKKLTKNPRKKYKIKHQNAMMHRKGQVRDIRRPTGSYGGEPTGININVSRSIRFKN